MSERSESTPPFGLTLSTDVFQNVRGVIKETGSRANLMFPDLTTATNFVNIGRRGTTPAPLTEEALVRAHEVAMGPGDRYHVSIGSPKEETGEIGVVVRQYGSGIEEGLGAAVLDIIQQMPIAETDLSQAA